MITAMDVQVFARPEYLDVEPGTVDQVRRTTRGHLVAITDDAQGVVRDLVAINPELRVYFNPYENLFIVYTERALPNGSTDENLFATAQQLDQRLVHMAHRVCSQGYSLIDEVEKLEAAADAEQEYQRRQVSGDAAEKLGHAFRKDLSRHEAPYTAKSRAFIAKAFKPEG